MAKFSDKIIRVESFWSFGNLVWTAIVALWGSAMTWAWSLLSYAEPFGYFGYGVVFIVSCLALAIVFWAISTGLYQWTRWRLAGVTPPTPIIAALPPADNQAERPSERDDKALEELTIFALDHVLPAISDLAVLQTAMLRNYQGTQTVGDFAIYGIYNRNSRLQAIHEAYHKISELCGSPAPQYSLGEMENFVHCIEQNYRVFVSQLHQIAVGVGIDHRNQHEFTPQWQSWREKHDAMNAAYDVIRRSKKFNKLYRPGLPNRFNEGVA